MTTLLLLIIFVAYIGLGIPDSLLGAAWPAIYEDLNLPVSYASYISMLVSIGTIISSFMSGKVIKKFGTAAVSVVSTILTAAALLGFAFSKNMIWFCVLALPLGLGAGSVDTALNNYVALRYSASSINFLHCSYGIGVAISPYLMSVALSDSNNWRRGYLIMFAVQSAIALLLIVTLPVWKKVKSSAESEEETEQTSALTMRQALKMKSTKPSIGIFMGSCAIESLCLVWGSTFLVQTKNIGADDAAKLITVYFIGMTAGRFLSGILSKFVPPKKIIVAGQIITMTAIIIMFIPSTTTVAAIGFFLIGFGNGPLFPNMTHLTPIIFGKSISQSIIGTQMGFSYISILLTPLIFGNITRFFGVWLFPYCLAVMFVVMAFSTFLLFGKQKNK